jgi:hypothetical protein
VSYVREKSLFWTVFIVKVLPAGKKSTTSLFLYNVTRYLDSESIHAIDEAESKIKSRINDLLCFSLLRREWEEKLCLIYGEGPENGQ